MNNIYLSKQFNDQLVNLINSSQLSIDVVYYIMKSATAELQMLYEQTCCQQSASIIDADSPTLQTKEVEPETVNVQIPKEDIDKLLQND